MAKLLTICDIIIVRGIRNVLYKKDVSDRKIRD